MNNNYSKVLIVLLIVVEFCMVFLTYKSFSNKDINKIKEIYKVDKKMFAMYIENPDTGDYDEYTDGNYWPSGYILNEAKTSCVDSKGESVSANSLLFASGKVTVSSNKTLFCYLYFDKDKSVYAKVASDYANNNGAALLSETVSDEYPTYYYTGSITNNNILYGDYCWKMVITTETGGVKLIYNGVPTVAEDGTKTCNNTGSASQLSSAKAFNSSYNSPAYVGYMYNTVYKYSYNGYTTSKTVLTSRSSMTSSSNKYYFGDLSDDSYSSGTYTLTNAATYDWSSSYSSLVGKYTCLSTTATSCSTIYYVAATTSSAMYYYSVSGGNTYDNYKVKLATSVTDNGDGTYTLVSPIEVSKADWYTNYSNYKNYYYCNDLTSDTCGLNDTIMYYSTSTSSTSLTGLNRAPYKYGNSFEDTNNDGIYELKDTKEFWDWPANYNTLNNNHYTCFNTTGECTDLKYIYYTNNSNAYYITLSGGKTVEVALNEMLYADDVNKTDSTIKNYIDTWYEGAILDKIDENGNLYSNYLENTIFCNNRATTNLSSSGWNPNGGSTTTTTLYFNYNSLECENKTDQFTLKVEMGGTEGYGNNALDYPIGLLSYKEALLASLSGYLKSGSSYWLFSPYSFGEFYARGYRVPSSSTMYRWNVNDTSGVRPVVSLANNIQIIGGTGDGSVSSPYQIEIPS